MPQFSDLSDRQLHDIARYIHFARQQGRYKEIVEAKPVSGEAAAGASKKTSAVGERRSAPILRIQPSANSAAACGKREAKADLASSMAASWGKSRPGRSIGPATSWGNQET